MSSDTTDLDETRRRSRRSFFVKLGAVFGSAAFGDRASAQSTAQSLLPLPISRRVRCLLKGARVLTVGGQSRIEDLAIGDLLPTMFGGTVPVEWIGRYPLKRSNPSKPWPKDARPVRIARSALAPNVPQADLIVSQAHGLFIDGVLVSAGCLVNGTSITLEDASEFNELEFFHVKLEKHDVIYAEGTPVETLLDVDEGAVNFAEYFRMHGAPAAANVPCAPILSDYRRGSGFGARVKSAASWLDRRRRIGAIRGRLAERAGVPSGELEPSL